MRYFKPARAGACGMEQQRSFKRGMRALLGFGVASLSVLAAIDGFRAYKTLDDFKFSATAVTADGNAPKFGPYAEDMRSLISAPGVAAARDYMPTAEPRDMPRNFAMLRQNRAELDSALNACTTQRCPNELTNYRNVIADIRQVPDKRTQLALVNGWVNAAILYDDGEYAARSKSINVNGVVAGSRPRSLVETLRDGKGICDEQAQLKLDMLSRVGFPQRDLRYVALMVTERAPQRAAAEHTLSHAVLLARAGGQTYALTNQSVPGWNDTVQTMVIQQLPQVKNEMNYLGIVARPENMTNIGWDVRQHNSGVRFFPVQAINYDGAALYAGVQFRDTAPFYVGQRFPIPVFRQEQPDIVLGSDLENVAVPSRPAARRVLENAVNYHALVAFDPRNVMTISAGMPKAGL